MCHYTCIVCLCMYACTHLLVSVHLSVFSLLEKVRTLGDGSLSTCGSCVLNLSPQAWQPVPLLAEQPHQPHTVMFVCVLRTGAYQLSHLQGQGY